MRVTPFDKSVIALPSSDAPNPASIRIPIHNNRPIVDFEEIEHWSLTISGNSVIHDCYVLPKEHIATQ